MKAIRCFGTWRVTDPTNERNNTADLNLQWLIPRVHEVWQWIAESHFSGFALAATMFSLQSLVLRTSVTRVFEIDP